MIPKLIIHPETEKIEEYVENFIGSLGFHKNHPDLMWFKPEEKLGIEQARKIKDFLSLKPYQSGGQIIVITSAQNLTTDAQNALLKTLEEHADGITFILGVSSEDQLLSTIISRCQIINLPIILNPNVIGKYQKDIEKLLDYTMSQRFQFIEKLQEKEAFLFVLMTYFRNLLIENIKPRGLDKLVLRDYLKDLIEGERWADQNVNIRAILEYLMLKMPQVSD